MNHSIVSLNLKQNTLVRSHGSYHHRDHTSIIKSFLSLVLTSNKNKNNNNNNNCLKYKRYVNNSNFNKSKSNTLLSSSSSLRFGGNVFNSNSLQHQQQQQRQIHTPPPTRIKRCIIKDVDSLPRRIIPNYKRKFLLFFCPTINLFN